MSPATTASAADLRRSGDSTAAATSALSRVGDFVKRLAPPPPTELKPWRQRIHGTCTPSMFYRWSSWMYTVVGLVIVVQAVPLAACLPTFPFSFYGISLMIQGWASYMNDVVTWGLVGSLWKPFDRVLATVNTVVAGILVAAHHIGEDRGFPPFVAAALSIGLAVALYCKWRSASALHARDCAGYLVWHSGWHYTLPLMASAAIMWLEHPGEMDVLA